jgi:Domain of unknown function (DUF4396)
MANRRSSGLATLSTGRSTQSALNVAEGGRVVAPDWLTAVAWFYLSLCFCCAGIIGYDIVVNHRRQPMGVMNFVFPITALYFGPFALAFYWRWARARRQLTVRQTSDTRASVSEAATPHAAAASASQPARRDMANAAGRDGGETPEAPAGRSRPWWVTMAIEVSHCGSGCALGDVISEFVVFAAALTIAGLTIGAEYLGDYLLALILGIIFQYFAIAPMRGLGVKDGLIAATKADFISLTAFEIGLFGWMAIMAFVLFPAPHQLMPNSAAFWLLMQVGMIIGFFASWPANVWLVKRGIKVPM